MEIQASDGQRVTTRDAVALGAALRKAASDPRRNEVDARVSREQSEVVRAILRREHGVELPLEKLDERTIDSQFLEELVSFSERGSFTVT